MVLFIASALAVGSLAVAVHAVRAQRSLSSEVESLRGRVAELGERLASAERNVGEAATEAEAAGTVLLEKGLVDEEDLEAARRRFDAIQVTSFRGSRTVH